MKKIILAATLLALVGSECQTVKANGWPIAAGVLGGLAVGTAVAAAAQPVYYSAPPVNYYPPRYYYAPAPAVTYAQPAPAAYYAQTAPAYYYAPAPRVVYPSFYAPFPVLGFGFGFGHPFFGGFHGGFHGGGFHRGR